jgi:hypothetical protein
MTYVFVQEMVDAGQRIVMTFADSDYVVDPGLWPSSLIFNHYADSPVLATMSAYCTQNVSKVVSIELDQ